MERKKKGQSKLTTSVLYGTKPPGVICHGSRRVNEGAPLYLLFRYVPTGYSTVPIGRYC
jgi:hypothetical protein